MSWPYDTEDFPSSSDNEYYNCDDQHGSSNCPVEWPIGLANSTNVTEIPTSNGTYTLPSVLFMSITSSILGLMILATIIGNVFVIAAVLKEKNLQSVANYLIVSLAVADLMVACLVMPMGAIYAITGNNWIMGPVACDVWTSSDVLCCTASILHLVAIAVDRFWAVTDIEYIRSRNRSRINTMILLVWLVAVVVSIAPILGWKDPEFYVRVEIERKCLVSQDVGYQIFATWATFYVPLSVILLLYWKIFQTARQRIRHRPGRLTEKKVAIAEEISSTRVDGANGGASGSGTNEQASSSGEPTENTKLPNKTTTDHQNQLPPSATSPSGDDEDDDEDDDDDEDYEADGGGSGARNGVRGHAGGEGEGKKSETIESLIDATTTPEEYGEDEECHISTINTTMATYQQQSTPTTLRPTPPNNNKNHQFSPINNDHHNQHHHQQFTSPTINVIEPTSDSKTSTIPLTTLSPAALATTTGTTVALIGGKGSPGRGSGASGGGGLASPSRIISSATFKAKQKSSKESIEVKRERKAAKTLAIITGAFVMCWLPFFVMALLMAICNTSCFLPDEVATSFLWLGYFNSTLNPIIYNVFSPEFRLAFKRILFGRNYGRRRRK